MAIGDNDLMMALGTPEGAPAKPKAAGGSSYLAGKPPKLKAYLMDAVDASLSSEERAEALCRAIEESGAAPEEETEEAPLEAPAPAEEEYEF